MKNPLVPVSILFAAAGGWFGHALISPRSEHPNSATPSPLISKAVKLPVPAKAVAVDISGGSAAAGKSAMTACRQILKVERNPYRANVKILAMLDTMDVAAIEALAARLGELPESWTGIPDPLQSLVFSKLAELDPARAITAALSQSSPELRSTAVFTVIKQVAAADPALAESMLEKLPAGNLRHSAIGALGEELARSDGPAALSMMQRQKLPGSAGFVWAGLMRAWTTNDPAGAAASLSKLPRKVAVEQARTVASAWSRRDPEAAMAWIARETDPAIRSGALSSAIASIAKVDPDKAIAFAGAQPTGERRRLLQSAAASMAGADPQKALQWAGTLSDPMERQRCMAAIASASGYSDPDTARAAVAMMPPGVRRSSAMGNIAGQMSWSDPVDAKEWASGLKGEDRMKALQSIVYGFSKEDPDEAVKLMSELPAARNGEWAWRNIAESKALIDPASALTWAAGLDSEQARVTSLRAIIDNWASHSPEKAAAALSTLSDPNQRFEATATVASSWAGRSPEEAERWASSLSGDDRVTALTAVWKTSALDDPERAASSLSTVTGNSVSEAASDKIAASAASIASTWTGENPPGAAAWALSLPEGKLREEAMGSVASTWARYDPEAASSWINSLPHNNSRDVAISKLVTQISSSDPESAFKWAASIDNGEKQVEALKATASTWKNLNADAARSAVQSSSLSDDIKSRVMESIR